MVMHVDDDKHICIRNRLNSDVIIYIFVSNFSNYNKKDNPGWSGKHQDLLYKLPNLVNI